MCSSPKASSLNAIKKVRSSGFSGSDFSNYVAAANAADDRRKEKKRLERERLKLEKSKLNDVELTAMQDETNKNFAL